MREIKFRAWDTKSGRFTKDGELFLSIDSENYNLYSVDFDNFRLENDNYILMQSTGLKDKNGVEIYEGDIVERTYLFNGEYGETHTGEVVYDKEYARYVISRPQKHIEPKTEDLRNILSDKSTYEVIGNRYENPELLKGQNK